MGRNPGKMGSDREPLPEPQDHGFGLFLPFSSSPGGPGHTVLPGVRIDDSCSKNSPLHLKDQPKKGNSLASGILLGRMGTALSLAGRGGNVILPHTKPKTYLLPEAAAYSPGG